MSGAALRARPSSGFTLIEVLAVLFLTALVLGAALGFYVDLSNESARASESTREVRRATTLIDRIARDLERTLLVKKPSDEDPLANPWIFLAESHAVKKGSDRLKFMVRGEPPRTDAGPSSDLATVAYMLEPGEDGGASELRRWSSPRLPERQDLEFPRPDDPASLVLADGVAYFALRFLTDAGEWVDSWDSSQMVESSELPVAVEIELALAPETVAPADGAIAGEAAEPLHYARRVLLPMRPLDLAALLDPKQVAANGDENGDCESGYTVADCIDMSKLGAGGAGAAGAAAAAGGGLGALPPGVDASDLGGIADFIATVLPQCWEKYRAQYANHPAVRDFCR